MSSGGGSAQPASSGNGAGAFTIEKLRGSSNYVSWKFSVKMVLIMENLWEYVEPLESDNDDTNQGQRTVDTAKDQRALARICLSIEPSLYQYVREAKSAQDAWNKLAAIFEDRGLYRRVLLLLVRYRKQIEDDEVAEILLSGLPAEYDVLVSNLETACISSSLTSELVRTRLLQEEMRKNGNNEAINSSESAYFVKKKKLFCNYCKKEGHSRNKCFKLRKQKKDKTERAFIVTDSAYSVTQEDFVVDSGCSSHMIKNKNLLDSFKPNKSNVCIANNEYLESEGSGKLIIPSSSNSILQIEAMLVPKLAMNLLSVSKLVKGGLNILFDKKGCHLFNDKNFEVKGEVVGHACNVNGVYKLGSITPGKSTSLPLEYSSDLLKEGVQEKQSAMLVSAGVWHKRLGHISYKGADSEYCTGDEGAQTAASPSHDDLSCSSLQPDLSSRRGEAVSCAGRQVPGSVADTSRPVRSTRGKPPPRIILRTNLILGPILRFFSPFNRRCSEVALDNRRTQGASSTE
ncbi:gag-polypeptide of LTR copia-type domain-containing protein [Phthorimaea operculella]|nr:gag-polypeptide of LTR copia-type domain-containing protein [Phthorimaea operculella]